jgi:two-component system OmpR family sensor kinase
MEATPKAQTGRRRRAYPVRTRVLTLNLVVILAGLLLAGAVTFGLQFAQLNQRIEDQLEQEVEELRQLTMLGPERNGVPYDDLHALFFAYLQNTIPGDDEWMMTWIDETPGPSLLVPGGEGPFKLDQAPVLDAVETHYQENRGVFTDVTLEDGRQVRLVIAAVQLTDEDPRAALIAGIDVGAQRQPIFDSMRNYALVALVTAAVAAFTGYWATKRVLRPLSQLREATSSISAHELTRRVEIEGADPDIAELAVTFNQMLDRLEKGFSDQRRFLDDAAHELRTPLTIIRGNLELMATDDPEDVASTRDLVLDEMDRMQRLVDDLLLLARSERPDFLRLEEVDVLSLFDEIKDRVHLIGRRDWRSSSEEGVSGPILADRQRVLQAVVQLAANAVKFTEPDDRINLGLAMRAPSSKVLEEVPHPPARRYLVISVEDTGVGIPADQLDRIFDRFARGEEHQHTEGSGLGLAIVLAIARAHRGAITVESAVGVGSAFRLWLPADDVGSLPHGAHPDRGGRGADRPVHGEGPAGGRLPDRSRA